MSSSFNDAQIKKLRARLWVVAGSVNRLLSPFSKPEARGWTVRAAEQVIADGEAKRLRGLCPLCRIKQDGQMMAHLLGTGASPQCEVIKAGALLHQIHNIDIPANASAVQKIIGGDAGVEKASHKENPVLASKKKPAAKPAPAVKLVATVKPAATKKIKPDVKEKTDNTPAATVPKSVAASSEIAAKADTQKNDNIDVATSETAAVDVKSSAPTKTETATPPDATPVMAAATDVTPAAVAPAVTVAKAVAEKVVSVSSVPRAASPADERFESAFVELLDAVSAPAEEPTPDRLLHLPSFNDKFQKVAAHEPTKVAAFEKDFVRLLEHEKPVVVSSSQAPKPIQCDEMKGVDAVFLYDSLTQIPCIKVQINRSLADIVARPVVGALVTLRQQLRQAVGIGAEDEMERLVSQLLGEALQQGRTVYSVGQGQFRTTVIDIQAIGKAGPGGRADWWRVLKQDEDLPIDAVIDMLGLGKILNSEMKI